jgi:hypothetical protein
LDTFDEKQGLLVHMMVVETDSDDDSANVSEGSIWRAAGDYIMVSSEAESCSLS